jgi:hypothetical protein
MTIVFAGYQKDDKFFDKMSVGEQAIIHVIHEYVEGRLKPLQDEIDKEELTGKPKSKGVIINYPENGIGCTGYSPELQAKILASFSQDDIDGLTKIALGRFS